MPRILREYYSLDYNTARTELEEAKKNGGPLVVPALLQRAEAKNQNGRVYPRKILEREVENYQKAIKERRALGSLDHPESSIVELHNASHLVTEMWWDGNDVKGKVEVLNTPARSNSSQSS